MTNNESVASKMYQIAKNGANCLCEEYKLASELGQYEMIIFNSLHLLKMINKNYNSLYPDISKIYFKLLIHKAQLLGVSLNPDQIIAFINKRFVYYNDEIKSLYSGEAAIPALSYHTFFIKPMDLNPIGSEDLMEILIYTGALVVMMKQVDDNSKNL